MIRIQMTRYLFCLAWLVLLMSTATIARASVVAVLFTGFNPDSPSGMDLMNDALVNNFASDFPSQTFSSQVFTYDQQNAAFNFINSQNHIDELFLLGHSWGGNALIRLATNLLLPNGINVDATFQIDSVDIFGGGLGDNVLPSNVDRGYNFFQIPTGFLEPGGEQNVVGALNFNAEDFFNDPSITHTSIDNDVRLYDLFYSNMRSTVGMRTSSLPVVAVPEPGSALIFVGISWAFCLIRTRRTSDL